MTTQTIRDKLAEIIDKHISNIPAWLEEVRKTDPAEAAKLERKLAAKGIEIKRPPR